eukprot:29938_1
MSQLKVLLFSFFIHAALCNTITETSSRWSKNIVCDDNEDCWINCEGADSCYSATIQCPQNCGCACHLSCTGTNACDTIKLYADAVSSLSIDCVQPSGSGSSDTTCYNMRINATGSTLYPSTSSVNINCNSDSSYSNSINYYPCGYSTFALINFNSISVQCDAQNSCQGITLMSYNNNKVDVNCNEQSSCIFAKMYINDSDTVSINPTDTDYALKSSEIYINGVTDKLSQINCNGKQTCRYADFTFKNIENNGVSMYCVYAYDDSYQAPGSCGNVNLYLDSSYTFNLHCYEYGCNDMKINGDCQNARVYCDGCHDVQADYCENNDNLFIYPPSVSPTIGPTIPPPPTVSNPEQYSSSSYNIVGFTLSLLCLTSLLVIVSTVSYNKYKTNPDNNTYIKNEEPMIPQHVKLSLINDEEQKNDGGDAIFNIGAKKSTQEFEKLGKEELLPAAEVQVKASEMVETTWCEDIMIRKNCYFELIPHLIDHCFAIAVILKFYDIQQGFMLLGSCLIVVFYRVVSSIQMLYYTHSTKQTLLQVLDMECFEALIVNYKGDQDDKFEPCGPQKWISLMEAAFQTVPMSVFLMTYLISHGCIFSKYVVIIQFAMIWCLVVIVVRNMNEDEVCFKHAITQRLKARLREDNIAETMELPSKYPWMLMLRFCDTICRICSVSILAAINIYVFTVFIIIEFIALLIYGYYKKHISDVIYHMFIRCDITDKLLTTERCMCTFVFLGVAFVCVMFGFAVDSLVGVFAYYFPYIIGVINFFFIGIIAKRFTPAISWYNEKNAIYFNKTDTFNQSRSIDDLINRRLWRNILDFIEFGFDIEPPILLTKHEKLLEYVSEDLEENGAKRFLYFLMNSTNLSAKHYNDMYIGALQAYENKESFNEDDYKEASDLLKQLIGNESVNINYQTSHNNRTALHILCLKGHQYLLDLILNESDREINPNLFDNYGETPLHIICKENESMNAAMNKNNVGEIQISILQKLFTLANININIQSDLCGNETPLHYSIKYNNYSLVTAFISNNTIDLTDNIRCGNNENYLHYCARNNGQDENIVLMIFNNDKYKYNVNTIDANGNTVLHKSYEKPNFTQKLLECKEIDVNIGNNKGIVAIINAIQYKNNNYALVKLIKYDSLNINAIDNNGDSTLHFGIKSVKNNAQH